MKVGKSDVIADRIIKQFKQNKDLVVRKKNHEHQTKLVLSCGKKTRQIFLLYQKGEAINSIK